MATVSDLQQLYIGYFGRAADQAGLNFWVGAIASDELTLADVHASFVASEEFNTQYAGLSLSQKVSAVYQNVLGRAVDADGLAFWTGAIDNGTITEAQLIEGLLSGLSPLDAATVANKVSVANYYTTAAGDKFSAADVTNSGALLATVGSSVDSMNAALTAIAKLAAANGNSNTALASALSTLDAAHESQIAYAEAFLANNDLTSDDLLRDGAAVTAAGTQINNALSDERDDLNALLVINGSSNIASTDSTTVGSNKIQIAVSNATDDVNTATAAVANVAGLRTLYNDYVADQAAVESATTAQNAALLAARQELGSFNALSGNNYTFVDLSDAGDDVADNLEITDLFELNAQGTLVLDAAFLATNPSAAVLAGANALLADFQALQSAVSTLSDAQDDLTATNTAITNASGTTLVNNLYAAETALSDLNEAVTDYNGALATSQEWTALGTAIINAMNSITTGTGYDLVEVVTTGGTNNNLDVFTFNNVDISVGKAGSATITAEAGDVLFVGSNYVLGTDTDLITAGIQGGNNSAFEVFFSEVGGNAVVQIENSVFGSSTATPEVTTVTLTGIVVDQLSFDASTGMINIATA